jgi:hypothetical protein
MARQMNVENRLGDLRKALEYTAGFQQKANKISQELTKHYKGEKGPQAKQALKTARAAKKLATALGKVQQISI